MGISINNNFINNKPPYLQKDRLDRRNYNKFYKPLNSNVQFRGLFNPAPVQKFVNKILPPKVTYIPNVLEKRALALLSKKSDNLAGMYVGAKKEFIERIKNNEKFRIMLGINKETLEKINNGEIISIPEPNLLKKFIGNIFTPLKIFSDMYSSLLNSKFGKWTASKSNFVSSLAKRNEQNVKNARILKEYKSYTGLIDSIKIWEAKQREIAGLPGWDNSKPLLISDEVLESKVMRRWLKSVDPTKGKYQTKHQMLGNRLISGLVYGTFLGNDAYNTTIRYANDKNEANAQRRSRFAQELAKIGINMYLINLFVGTFEKYVNKSLFHALFTAGATTMTAEILGRKLVGRPIFPSDKKTLDDMTKKMEEKKGFWVSVGRLITGTRAKPKIKPQPKSRKLMVVTEQRALLDKNYNINQQSEKQKNPQNFGKNIKSGGKQISFGSFYKTTNMMDSKTLKALLALVKKADEKIYNTFVEILEKSFDKKEGKNLAQRLVSDELVPIGTKKTPHGNLLRSLASPYFFIKDTFKKIGVKIKKSFVQNNPQKALADLKTKLEGLKKNNPEIEKQYGEFLNKLRKSNVWRASVISDDAKEVKILEEFLEAIEKDTEEVEGVKNIFLFLEKHLKSRDLTKENVDNVKKLLFENFKKTDGAAHVEYDGNTFAMMNINLSRAITTLFLVVDAYNLSIQYSNNDKQIAINNGKSRALQEASRITVSAYMLAFFHNLLSKFCNSSLFGAFTTTAITSSVNDTLARKVVGVPIGTKTREQLMEIDRENAKSKSPLKRALAYLIGKKQKPQGIQSSSAEKPSDNELDFSLSITKQFKTILDDE